MHLFTLILVTVFQTPSGRDSQPNSVDVNRNQDVGTRRCC